MYKRTCDAMTIMVTHYMDVNVFKHVLGWQLK